MESTVTHDKENSRFEIHQDGERVGLMDYVISGDRVSLVHTEVKRELRGQNLAAILLRESLKEMATWPERVVPVCSYTVRYMEKHPETHALLAIPIEEAIASCRWPGPGATSL